MLRDTLAIQQCVLNDGHLSTLGTADSLSVLLRNIGQHAEAEALGRGALPQANRTLGPEHPDTLAIARTVAITLGRHD